MLLIFHAVCWNGYLIIFSNDTPFKWSLEGLYRNYHINLSIFPSAFLFDCPSILLCVHLSIYPSDFHVKNLFGVYKSLLDNPLLKDYIF